MLSSTISGSILGIPVSASNVKAANETSSVVDLEEYENNDIIVVYKKEANATKQKTLSICGLSVSDTEAPEVSELTDNSVVLKLDSEEELAEAVEALSQDSRVDYIQPNYVYRAFDVDITSTLETLNQNTDFSKQWAFYNDGTLTYTEEDYSGGGSYDDWWSWWSTDADAMEKNAYGGQNSSFTVQAQQRIDIRLPEALSICATPKREVVVAFVDTGIKYDHSELSNYMWVNEDEIEGDGIDNDGNGYIDDIHGWNFYGSGNGGFYMPGWPGRGDSSDEGNNTYYNSSSTTEDAHGTHGAGSVAAANDATGIVGIAANTNVKIMTLKALGGEYGYGSTESVVKGIQYAEANGAQICNLSLGGEADDTTLRSVIESSSMLFTIAAGNGDSSYNAVDTDKTPTYPSCYTSDNIINVANLQCDGNLHYTSNYGATSVDIAAPGSKIYSTSTDTSGYEEMTGTSMAAPIVAGVAAMLYSSYDNLTLSDVRNAILNSAATLESLDGKCVTGGMVNAYDAIRYIENGGVVPTIPGGQPTVTPTATITETPIITPEVTITEAPTKAPEVTVTEAPTPTPRARVTKAPTPTPKARVTKSPTEAPKVTVTEVPDITEAATPTPTATQAPKATKAPEATKVPEATKAPEATEVPEATQAPVVTQAPTTSKVDFLEVSGLKVSGSGKRTIGKTYTISAQAKGGNGDYQYRFMVSKNGKATIVQDYSSAATLRWTPTTSGTYNIRVSITDGNGDYDVASKEITVASLKIKNIKKNKSTLKKGTKVKLTANVTGSATKLSYQFTIKKSGKTVLKKNTSKSYITWKVPSKGTYKVKVTVTDKYGNKTTKTQTYKAKK